MHVNILSRALQKGFVNSNSRIDHSNSNQLSFVFIFCRLQFAIIAALKLSNCVQVACKGETTDTRGRCSSVEEPPRPKRAKLESSTDAAVLSPVVNTSACLETISQSVCNTSMDKNADDKKSCKVEEMEIVQSGEVLPMDMSVVIGQLQILFVHLQSSKRR